METRNKSIKKVLITIGILFLIVHGANAQKFETVKSGGFDTLSGTDTKTSITIEGEKHPIFTTSKGTLYIKCLSKRTGNNYAVWIGEQTEDKHEGRDVYQMKSGKYCVYMISEKTGNPYPRWLIEVEE